MRSFAVIVAALALGLAACSSDGSGSTTPTSASEKGQPVAVIEKDAHGLVRGGMFMIVSPSVVRPGLVTFTVTNQGTIAHELVVLKGSRKLVPSGAGTVSEKDAVGSVRDIAPGTSKSLTLNLEKGAYELVCNLSGHFARGMHGRFTVR